MDTIKEYYTLAKPGIIYGNVITTVAAFLFAWQWHSFPNILLLLETVIGIGLVIGSGCAFNNYTDRHIDAKMPRTQKRALVTGAISIRNALIYGTILGILGFALLFFFVNALTAAAAAVGFIFYVVLYALAKRASYWGAVVGSVSGAVPILVGYTAVTNRLDLAALLLFLALVTWQMPHFYAIAMYRLEEYSAAGILVLPKVKGMRTTKLHIVGFMIAFLAVLIAFVVTGTASALSFAVVILATCWWLVQGVRGFTASDEASWAKKTFLFSLIILLVFSATISISPLIR